MGVPMPAMMAAMGGMRMPGGGPPPANPGAPRASNGPPAQARPQKMVSWLILFLGHILGFFFNEKFLLFLLFDNLLIKYNVR